ncbi:ABC-2 type transport system permease protein [Terracoccus luteus]|uniref:ABC-2 type transport system permease protein n=1 Tax=Terracoccus luteus TaxID=53356 RepID=A0A495XYE1_9MICO|nr:ABC-2 family transporter protein [Terracoccus luteus]RKT78952.1 ABC-2 type transport system permease protein [Terracoccus luteus]
MAEPLTGPRPRPSRRSRRPDHLRPLHPYRVLLASRLRSQLTYRTSFATDVLGTLVVGLVELAEVWVIFHNVDTLGGLDFASALLVFALSNVCFAVADLLVGHLDSLPTYIRAGTVDAFYVRPLPLLAQLVSSDISLRRVGRLTVALVALVVGLATAGVQWSVAAAALLVLTIVSGTAVFAGLFTTAGALQFFVVDGAEVTNSFTYGGSYAAQQSQQVFPDPLRVFWTFVVPTAFVAYQPALTLLGRDDGFLPGWAGWLTPVAALLTWAVAATCWRLGTRHYQGAGG